MAAGEWLGALKALTQGVDHASEEGRAAERHRRLLLSAGASALAKVLSVLTALISVPLTLNHLGPERYGMWMTMTSLIAMMAFADLGMGNGLLNAVASASGRSDLAQIQRYISSAFAAFVLIAVAILVLFAVAYPFVNWPGVFNVQSALASQEAGPALAVFLACFALAIPVGIGQRVQMGMQLSFLSSVWQCASSVLGLLGVILAIRSQASLTVLVLAYVGLPLLASLLNCVVYFGWMRPDIRPTLGAASMATSREILHSGLLFFVLQLVVAVAYASDGFVVAQLLGPQAVAAYAVPEKMFSVVGSILAMMLAPLWPAYGEALARGDHEWVRRTLRRSLLMAVAASAFMSVVLVLAGGTIVRLWAGEAMVPTLALLLGLGVWKVFETSGNALAAYLNGANVVRVQVIISILTAITAVSLKLLLVPRFGIAGVPWATTAAFIVCAVIPYAFILPKLLPAKQGSVAG
jgi:O-antigen/teichoic acid export membrane protein